MKKLILFCAMVLVLLCLTSCRTCEHEFTEWSIKQPSTCAEKGTEWQTCVKCEKTNKRELELAEHTFSAWQTDTEPTCTAVGRKTSTCTVCNEQVSIPIDMLAHAWQDSTCMTPKTCSVCDLTEGNPGEHAWTQATCSAPKTCSICAQTEGAPAGHCWTDATCTTPKTCSVCAQAEGTPADHSWTDATCTTPKTCSVCAQLEGIAAGHVWKSATCTAPKTCSTCGATEGDTAGHIWTVATCSAPKTCTVCGATTGSPLGHSVRPNMTCSTCGKSLATSDLTHMVISTYQELLAKHPKAKAIGGYVHTYTSQTGDKCLLTYIHYRFTDPTKNYSFSKLYNLSTGSVITAPIEYYNSKVIATGGMNLTHIRMAKETIEQHTIAERGIQNSISTGKNSGPGTYVSANLLG